MKVLVTGGNGNIAKMIHRNLCSTTCEIVNLSRKDLNVLNLEDIKQYLDKNKFDVLETKIRPWLGKILIEYIGEDEPNLKNMIIKKKTHSKFLLCDRCICLGFNRSINEFTEGFNSK